MIEARLRLPRRGFTLDVALNLPAHGVSALFGPSGCGKTTVLRALAGLERAQGRVALGGTVWQDDAQPCFVPTHRRPLGYVIQESALFPHLDVRRNLAYGLNRIPAVERRIALDQVVDLLGIAHLLDRRPDTLSGGERQRVAIARALATSPRLLLMDEPLAALDAQRKAEVLPYLDRLHEELGIPVVYVSHSIDEVARLADHLVILEAGRVLADGPLPDMLARLDLPVAFGDDAGVVLDATIGERDARWQLVRLDVDGEACRLWTRDQGLPVGRRVRLRVLARDVSLTRTPQTGTSIGNQLRGTIEAIADDAHPALALVRVRVGAAPVVARLTRRSAHALELAVGMPVWAQVKTVALME
ncbi:molybdenum ABC transporter ATP-binding protein [uncultured Piscinibacter sp.]|uniref:molybdenum ABC transporter ATP-binding protein n=1 Tax=uncultured Piscinibacter sp. TaxID=1131835 RepID=UPI002632C915|nr:molybdenum ABC transporter ATP-binding protein [uncultured Piscinibacter sp.]